MSASKAAERDPLLPYTRQFGSINEDDDDGKRFERRGASSDDVENGRKKTFFLFDAHSHASRAKIHAFLYVLMACVLFFSGAIVGSSSSSSSKMILMSKEDGVSSAKGPRNHHHRLGTMATIENAPGQKTLSTLMNNNNKNKNTTNNNNNNKTNGTSQSSDVDDSSSSSESSSGGQEGASEEDAYQSLMEMFGIFGGAAPPTREAIEEPEPSLSEENQDLLKEEENHYSRIGSDLGYFRAPSVRNDTLVFVSEGSIWLSHLRGGPAARISSSYSYESVPKLSPDGKRIAFLAEAADGFEVFELPIAGGVARQVTHGAQAYGLSQWSGDHELLILTTQFSDLGCCC